MSAPLEIVLNEAAPRQVNYGWVAEDTLRILWRRKGLIAAILGVAIFLALAALVLIGPRYTGEATIQLNFNREDQTTGPRGQPSISMDAIALVDSAARVIRSRAVASAVVARLGLDGDPDFTREPALWRLLSAARRALGLPEAAPSARDLAANALMQKTAVTNEPRSYLISIAVTTADPKQAATLANSIAQEYLRGQLLNQLAEERSATQRELAQLSSVYGARHPNYVLEQSKFEALQARLSALREEPPGEDAANLVPGQSFAPAEMVMVPSGPNAILILGITVGGALAAGIWLALFLRPHSAIPALGLTPYGGEQPSGSRIVTRSPDARPRRPANRGAIIVALIGWPLFFWSLASPFRQWAQEHTRLAAVEQQNQLLDGELKKERAAAGSLSDIEIRRTVAESGATAARQAAADAAQARREAEAEASHARDALAEAAAGREAAEKATSEAGAEHTRIAAEVDALARQAAWLNEQIAGRKSERAGVDKQVGDLRTTLASLAAAREQAAAAIEVAKTARDAIVAESAAAEKSADALKQQSAQLNADLAARKDDLAAIQDRLAKAQAEAAEQRDIEKKLVAARDQLKKVQDQNAREQQAARDASDQVAARNRDLADLENQLAQDREASNRVTAQRAEIERVVADSTARRDQLAADAERAQNAASDLQKRLTVLDDEATRRNRALAVLDAQLKSARTELEDVQSQIATARQNPPPVPPAAAAAETQAADSTRNGGVRE